MMIQEQHQYGDIRLFWNRVEIFGLNAQLHVWCLVRIKYSRPQLNGNAVVRL